MSHTTSYLQSLPTLLDADISTLVNYIVHDAVQSGASDIHLEPWQESMAVRIRVSGYKDGHGKVIAGRAVELTIPMAKVDHILHHS